MDQLGDDLLLLVAPPDGRRALPHNLRYGLSGAELVRLAAARRVDIVRGRIVILDTAPTGDLLLDEALANMASMTGGRRGPTAMAWIAGDRRGLVDRYLARAEAAGTVRAESRRWLCFDLMPRWWVVDTARAARPRARLEAIATGNGAVGPAQAALAGLAAAIGADREVFPGWGGAPERKQLRQAVRRESATAEVMRAAGSAADASARVAMAAAVSATQAAVRAADASMAAGAAAASAAAAASMAAAASVTAGG